MTQPFTKLSDARTDYEVDWSGWLHGDSIIESTWTPDDSGLVVHSASHTATTTTVWLYGGPVVPEGASPAYARCKVVNHISTSAGRQEDYTLHFNVR